MKIITGNCTKCGAPYHQEQIWHGITPPPIEPTCQCWNIPKTVYSTSAGTAGEHYPCKPKIFEATYEKVQDCKKLNPESGFDFDEFIQLKKDKRDLESHLESLRSAYEKENGLERLDSKAMARMFVDLENENKDWSTQDIMWEICKRFGSKRLPTVEEIEKIMRGNLTLQETFNNETYQKNIKFYGVNKAAKAIHAEISKSSEKKDIKII